MSKMPTKSNFLFSVKNDTKKKTNIFVRKTKAWYFLFLLRVLDYSQLFSLNSYIVSYRIAITIRII